MNFSSISMNNYQESGMKLQFRYQAVMLLSAPRDGGEYYQRKLENLGQTRKILKFWN